MWVDIIQSTESPNRTKHWGKGKLALSNWAGAFVLSYPLDFGAPGSWVFGLCWNLYHCSLSFPPPSPSQVFNLRLNYTTGSPGFPACRWQSVGLLSLLIKWANSYNKFPCMSYWFSFPGETWYTNQGKIIFSKPCPDITSSENFPAIPRENYSISPLG